MQVAGEEAAAVRMMSCACRKEGKKGETFYAAYMYVLSSLDYLLGRIIWIKIYI